MRPRWFLSVILASGGRARHAAAYNNLGCLYEIGKGEERDVKKAKCYYELAAMGGSSEARHALGRCEATHERNMKRAVKHYMISAGAGCDNSLKAIRESFMEGDATKEDFEIALRAHKEAKDEMRSDQREAAAVDKNFRRRCR